MQSSNNLGEIKTNNQSSQTDYLELARQIFANKIYNKGLKDFIQNSDSLEVAFEYKKIRIQCIDFERGLQFILNKKHYHIKFICNYYNEKIEVFQYRGDSNDLFNMICEISEHIENDSKEFAQKFSFEFGRKKQRFIFD